MRKTLNLNGPVYGEQVRYIPDNKAFPYSVKIHGNTEEPNPEAMKLAKKIIEFFDIFTRTTKSYVEAMVNPKIVEDGIEIDSFHFSDYENSFWVHLTLCGDKSAHWKVRFVRIDGSLMGNYRPCELNRMEL